VADDRRTPTVVIVRAGQAPGQGYNVSSPAVRRAAAQDQDSSGNGDLPRPAPQACSITDSDPKELAFKIVRGFARSNDISGAVGAGLHSTVAAMLLDRIEAKHIETALPAWLESGKPPDALPEFVQPPAEAETAP